MRISREQKDENSFFEVVRVRTNKGKIVSESGAHHPETDIIEHPYKNMTIYGHRTKYYGCSIKFDND